MAFVENIMSGMVEQKAKGKSWQSEEQKSFMKLMEPGRIMQTTYLVRQFIFWWKN